VAAAVRCQTAVKKYALVAALASDIARQLDGYQADPDLADAVRDVQARYKFEPLTAEKFEAMLRLVAHGASVRCRRTRIKVVGSGISPPVLCRYLANPALRARFEGARLHWREYREFGVLEIEEILDELATGDRTLQSVVYARGWNLNRYNRLLRAIYRAPEIQQAYYRAKTSQRARIGERLLEEAGEVTTREEGRALGRKIDLLRRRMPHGLREVYRRDRTHIETARRRAGLRQNGKPREPAP